MERADAKLDLIASVLHGVILAANPMRKIFGETCDLTARQRELIAHVRAGRTDREIAMALQISENTVGNHFRAIFQRMGVKKRAQLVEALR